MNKKYLSLGALAALAIVWFIGPIISVSIFGISSSITAIDAFENIDSAHEGILLIIFSPIFAIVLGFIGAFVNSAIAKISSIIAAIAYIAGLLWYCLDSNIEIALEYFGWGVYVMLALLVVNVILTITAKDKIANETIDETVVE